MVGKKTTMMLQSVTESVDTTGAVTETWEDVRELRGVLGLSKGDESLLEGKMTVTATHEFYMSTPAALSVSEKDRLRLGTRYYDILYVQRALEQRIMVRLFLKERDNIE